MRILFLLSFIFLLHSCTTGPLDRSPHQFYTIEEVNKYLKHLLHIDENRLKQMVGQEVERLNSIYGVPFDQEKLEKINFKSYADRASDIYWQGATSSKKFKELQLLALKLSKSDWAREFLWKQSKLKLSEEEQNSLFNKLKQQPEFSKRKKLLQDIYYFRDFDRPLMDQVFYVYNRVHFHSKKKYKLVKDYPTSILQNDILEYRNMTLKEMVFIHDGFVKGDGGKFFQLLNGMYKKSNSKIKKLLSELYKKL